MRFIGSDAVLGLWCSPVSGETPLHGTELTYADIAPLHLPYNARIKNDLAELEKVCVSGDGSVCHTLGGAMLEHRRAVEASALEYYQKACDLGHANGCFEQGRMVLQRGDGPDVDGAILLFSKGCVGGDIAACDAKASLLGSGEPLPHNNDATKVSD